MLSWMRRTASRLFAPRADGGMAVGTAGTLVRQDYEPLTAMSTMARFPVVVTCVTAKAGDLAGLPMLAVRREGTVERVLVDHPAVRLLRRPAPRVTGLQFRRQVYADFGLTGNAFMEHPASLLLLRMHPGLVREEIDPITGRQLGWLYNSTRKLPLEQVHHVAGISWCDTPSMVFGESPVRSLHDDLVTLMRASRMASDAAGRGRPEILFRPADKDVQLTDVSIRNIEKNWERHTKDGRGAFILGQYLDASPLNITPRDLEWMALRHDVRDTIGMLFEVPPARMGLATANYGTQKQQMRTYWEALLGGMGALFEESFSQLTGDDAVMLRHDRTNIEALQVSYTERQTRAERWVTIFGATAADAAAYEGFANAPVGNATGRSSRPIDRQPEEPQGDRGLASVLRDYLRGAAGRYQDRILEADGNAAAVSALHEETVRAAVDLERAGLSATDAYEWGEHVAIVADEAAIGIASDAWAEGVVRIGLEAMAAFGSDRAAELAHDIAGDLAERRAV